MTSFIEHHNAHPKPFRCTKSADDILSSIERFCAHNLPTDEGLLLGAKRNHTWRTPGMQSLLSGMVRVTCALPLISPVSGSRLASGYPGSVWRAANPP